MALVSPLRQLHQQAEGILTLYGPMMVPTGSGEEASVPVAVEVVEGFGDIELEYAAIRKHCGILDQPNRGVVEVRGRERLEFLNRMVTQELKDLPPFAFRRSFWLNRKGRIDADLRIIDLADRTLLDVDVHALQRTVEGLRSFVVSEDVVLTDVTGATHRLALHGPTALEMLSALAMSGRGVAQSGPGVSGLEPGRAVSIRISGVDVVVFREDATGEVGLELIAPAGAVLGLYEKLLASASNPSGEPGEGSRSVKGGGVSLGRSVQLRPIGWHAYNVARIEGGTPLYNLDFGPESLPAESGVLHDRVSFKKGCYLGQEVVARMHARGQVKQTLVGIAFESKLDPAIGAPRQPVTGAPLRVMSGEGGAEPAGTITSSAISPMLGATPVAFAQVKASHAKAGTKLVAHAGDVPVVGEVRPSLVFWSRR